MTISALATAFLAVSLLACWPGTVAAAARSGSAASSRPLRGYVIGGEQTASVTYFLSGDKNPEKGKITDTQTITLDAAYDVPLLSLLNPEHRIDLKWTIANNTTCAHLGTDPCDTPGLRYPGLDCVTANGHPTNVCGGPGWDPAGVTDDPKLACPVYSNGLVPPVPPGHQVTICTSSLLFPGEATSVASYSLGRLAEGYPQSLAQQTVRWHLLDPWDPGTGKPAVYKYRQWPCPDEKWSGDVPPPCTATGAFRRVYSRPGYFGAKAVVTLPRAPSDVPPALPEQLPKLGSQAGYAYLEAWTGTGENQASYEFGVLYHDDTNRFSLYARGSSAAGKYWWTHGILFNAGDRVNLALYSYPSSGRTGSRQWPLPPLCKNKNDTNCCEKGQRCLVGLAQDLTLHRSYLEAFPGYGWRGNDATLARMTTIAQDMKPSYAGGDYFSDGAIFGPVKWSAAGLARISASGVSPADWAGGEQSWPAAGKRVIVTDQRGLSAETDTLYLHP